MVKTPLTMLSRVSYSGYKYSSDNMAGTRMPFAFINPILKGENKILAQVQLNIYRSCLRGTFLIASANRFIVWWGANKAEL